MYNICGFISSNGKITSPHSLHYKICSNSSLNIMKYSGNIRACKKIYLILSAHGFLKYYLFCLDFSDDDISFSQLKYYIFHYL